MLQITVPATEAWDEVNERFIQVKETKLQLEHSLVSLSKWESKWCKSFLFTEKKTDEEILDYIKCMTLTQNVKPEVYQCLTMQNLEDIQNYISAPMTALYFPKDQSGRKSRERITSEHIHYWMTLLNIPQEYRKWHLNKLISFIRLCEVKSAPSKKRSSRELAKSYAQINAQNRAKFNSRG